jgi:hypothetical protein
MRFDANHQSPIPLEKWVSLVRHIELARALMDCAQSSAESAMIIAIMAR